MVWSEAERLQASVEHLIFDIDGLIFLVHVTPTRSEETVKIAVSLVLPFAIKELGASAHQIIKAGMLALLLFVGGEVKATSGPAHAIASTSPTVAAELFPLPVIDIVATTWVTVQGSVELLLTCWSSHVRDQNAGKLAQNAISNLACDHAGDCTDCLVWRSSE